MYRKASRAKLRFSSNRGQITVEDLWDIGMGELDEIAKRLSRDLKEDGEESFIRPIETKNAIKELRFEIVKDVIATRLAELDAAKDAAVSRDKKQRILAAMAKKKDDALEGASLEDLEDMLESL